MLPELHCHRMLPCALKISLTCSSWTSVFPPFARWTVDADMRSNWLRPDGTVLESVGRVFQRHGLCFWQPLGPKASGFPSQSCGDGFYCWRRMLHQRGFQDLLKQFITLLPICSSSLHQCGVDVRTTVYQTLIVFIPDSICNLSRRRRRVFSQSG